MCGKKSKFFPDRGGGGDDVSTVKEKRGISLKRSREESVLEKRRKGKKGFEGGRKF